LSDPRDDEPVDETRSGFAAALAGWGLTSSQVADTLEATDFGLGLVALRPPEGARSPGIAIVVADRRDPELRDLLRWRAEVTDSSYAAAWAIDESPQTRVVLGPDGQALVRFAVRIREPVRLERRFLFAVHAVAPILTRLQVAGAGLFLVAAKVIEREAVREGPPPPETYDVLPYCLRVGTIDRAIPSLDEALAHVGAPREPTLNRAARRAAQRAKKSR
jgi:hypothetical protein